MNKLVKASRSISHSWVYNSTAHYSILERIKQNRIPPEPELPGHESLANDSEFKQYFGITARLEEAKFKNDGELSTETRKLGSVSGIYSAVGFGFAIFALVYANRERLQYLLITYPATRVRLLMSPGFAWRPDG